MKRLNLSRLSAMAMLLSLFAACKSHNANTGRMLLARMEVKQPIKGVCDNNNVIAILPLPNSNQTEAKAPKTDDEIQEELNEEVSFLKDKPAYADKGIIRLIVNCKGEMVQCQMDNKTQSPELDKQIVSVFAGLESWAPGQVNGKPVDTVVLYSFRIENGKIVL